MPSLLESTGRNEDAQPWEQAASEPWEQAAADNTLASSSAPKKKLKDDPGFDKYSESRWVGKWRTTRTNMELARDANRNRRRRESIIEPKGLPPQRSASVIALNDEYIIKHLPPKPPAKLPTIPVKEKPVTIMDALPAQIWDVSWDRNDLCALSGKLASPGHRRECKYCPNVIRDDQVQHLMPAGHGLAAVKLPHEFVCPECEVDIQANVGRLKEAKRERELVSQQLVRATKLQASIRARMCCKQFDRAKKGATVLAAALRGNSGRIDWYKSQVDVRRPMILRVISAAGLRIADERHNKDGSLDVERSSSDPFVDITVRGRRQLSSKRVDQVFRLQSHVEEKTLDPVWNEDVLLPGVDGKMVVVLTVADKDQFRNDFLGQAEVDLTGTMVPWKGGVFELPLTRMLHPPLEKSGGKVRFGGSLMPGQGRVKFQLLPAPAVVSCSGFLEEKSNAISAYSAGKKWWCCLCDGVLRVYHTYGDASPRCAVKTLRGTATLVPGTRMPTGKIAPHLLKFKAGTTDWERTYQGATDADTENWAARLNCSARGGAGTSRLNATGKSSRKGDGAAAATMAAMASGSGTEMADMVTDLPPMPDADEGEGGDVMQLLDV